MGRKRDYSDFKKFAKKHKDLPRTKIIEEYRKAGGKVQKKKGLEVLRDLFNIEKGEQRGKTGKQIINYFLKNSYYKFANSKKEFSHISISNPNVRNLYNNIQELYNTSKKSFLSIGITMNADTYTFNNNFSIFIPFNGRLKQGVKSLGLKIIDNMKIYYNNLAKMYSMKNQSIGDILNIIKNTKRMITNSKYIDIDDLIHIFSFNDIEIKKSNGKLDINVINFVD